MGVRPSFVAALLGVLLAAIVIRGHVLAAGPQHRPTYIGTTSEGSGVTADLKGDMIKLQVWSGAGACTPTGWIPQGWVGGSWPRPHGAFHYDEAADVPVTVEGTTYARTIRFRIDGTLSGSRVVGRMKRVDTYGDRTCVRQATFTARK